MNSIIYLSIAILILLITTLYNWIRVDQLENKIEEFENKNYLIGEDNG